MERIYQTIKKYQDHLIEKNELYRVIGLNPSTETEESFCKKNLEKAMKQKDTEALALIIFLVFLFELDTKPFVEDAKLLIQERWHKSHEDLAWMLRIAKTPGCEEIFYETALMKLPYLYYDDANALAVNCIWALGDLNTLEARKKLVGLTQCENTVISEAAKYQLDRIAKER